MLQVKPGVSAVTPCTIPCATSSRAAGAALCHVLRIQAIKATASYKAISDTGLAVRS
jgi:hypothetical protein